MVKVNHQDMKEGNKKVILEFIRQRKTSSRKEIMEKTGLSLGTVSNLVNDLIRAGALTERTGKSRKVLKGAKGSGRKVIPLKINPDYSFFLGLEVSEENIISVIMDNCGNERFASDIEGRILNGKDLQRRVENSVTHALKNFSFPNRIKGIGICLSGSIDFERGIVVHSPGINVQNYPLKENLENKFQKPVVIENDARAKGFAESRFGSAVDARNFIYIHIGKGIGSAIILDGKLFRGINGMGGEIGHISIDRGESAPRCRCGNKGCLETFASCPAMVKRARELISQNVSNSLPARDLDFDCLVESARKGERIPLIVFEEVVPFLAQGIGDVANMFNPELVIIGGQAVSAKEFILEPLRISVRTRAISEVSDSLTIKFSSLEQNVGALGASALISEEVAGY